MDEVKKITLQENSQTTIDSIFFEVVNISTNVSKEDLIRGTSSSLSK